LIEEIINTDNLTVISFVLGPAMTNAYLVGDSETKKAVVIDPAWDGEVIAREADRRGWQIQVLFLTHGHFDHFGGAAGIVGAATESISVALHPDDHSLWQLNGGASLFGFPSFDPGPEPSIALEHGMKLALGNHSFEVRHTPGHTQGHVMFLVSEVGVAFCGDLIFMGSVGRTDLPGGNWDTLLSSIKQEVLSLPDETRLLSGHGPVTTVGQERKTNPFVLYDF
jgi:hydroxyacylglutathione hydrolase